MTAPQRWRVVYRDMAADPVKVDVITHDGEVAFCEGMLFLRTHDMELVEVFGPGFWIAVQHVPEPTS